MVRGTAVLKETDGIEMTVTLTMTVKEWKEIRTQLPAAWPSWQLSSTLRKVLDALVDRVESAAEATT